MGLFDSLSTNLGGGLMDPNQAAMLGLAQGLMAASGPSRMPIPLTSALGNGVAGAQQGLAAALQAQGANTSNQTNLMNLQMAQAQNKLFMDALKRRLSGQPQSSPDPSQVPQPQAPMTPAPSLMNGSGPLAGSALSAPLTSGLDRPVPDSVRVEGQPSVTDSQQPAPSSSGVIDPFDPLGIGLDNSLIANRMFPKAMESAIGATLTPTDFQKTLRAAGIDPNSVQGRALIQQQIAKQNEMTGYRPGSIVPDGRGGFTAMPSQAPDGYIPKQNPDGSWGYVPMTNGPQAVAASAAAGAAGKAVGSAVGPQTVFENGAPGVRMNPFGIDLGNLFGGSNPAPAASSGATPPVSIPGTIPFGRTPSGFVQTGPGLGAEKYANQQADAAAGRGNSLVASSADSPMRVNVLDNIIALSKKGVATGPTQGFLNELGGYATSNPVGAALFPGWRDQVTGAQEMNKFMYQNALRNWSAAGGTQTDSQLTAQSQANPNDKLFPDAVQHVAQWGKAGELALQAKANSWQQYKAQNGDTPASQTAFENQWRQNFRPNDFIKQTIDPVNKRGWQLHQDSKSGELAYVNPKNPKQFAGIW